MAISFLGQTTPHILLYTIVDIMGAPFNIPILAKLIGLYTILIITITAATIWIFIPIFGFCSGDDSAKMRLIQWINSNKFVFPVGIWSLLGPGMVDFFFLLLSGDAVFRAAGARIG